MGEVVVTTLSRGYPLIRFATGDLSAVLPGRCPTGRSNQRLRGWLGAPTSPPRCAACSSMPAQVAELLRRHPELQRARLVVRGELAQDRLTLQAESPAAEGLAERLALAVRELTQLRAEVELLPPGSLPNDGRLILDERH